LRTELGVNPSGSYSDVATRLAEFRKSVAGVVSDASFTSTPADGATGVNTINKDFAYRSGGQWWRLPSTLPGDARRYMTFDGGVVDQTANMQAGLDALNAMGGGVFELPDKTG
jgi:hypothetical protein